MGVLDLEFPQGTDKSLFLESAYVMDFLKEENDFFWERKLNRNFFGA